MALAPSAQQLDALERPVSRAGWWWVLVGVGALAAIGLSAHGYTAYLSIAGINAVAKEQTPNVLAMFQDVATNGPRVGASIDTASRATYTTLLEQFVLDGTGVCLGLVLIVAGVFVRLNE